MGLVDIRGYYIALQLNIGSTICQKSYGSTLNRHLCEIRICSLWQICGSHWNYIPFPYLLRPPYWPGGHKMPFSIHFSEPGDLHTYEDIGNPYAIYSISVNKWSCQGLLWVDDFIVGNVPKTIENLEEEYDIPKTDCCMYICISQFLRI